MKRWSWSNLIAYAVVFAVIIAAISGLFGNATSANGYVKDHYPLIDAQTKGKSGSKIYLAENKDVPTVAKEMAEQQKPKEISKESLEQMFLVYKDSIVNLQKDPQNAANTIVEIDTIQYARDNYDSSFLQGFLTAAVLQSLFDTYTGKQSAPSYRGYTYNTGNESKSPAAASPAAKDQPATNERSGSFTSKSNSSASPADNGPTKAPAADTQTDSKPDSKTSGTTGTFRTNGSGSSSSSSSSSPPSTGGSSSGKSSSSAGSGASGSSSSSNSSSSSSRKNDGSSPSYKAPSKPSTSKKSGSFSSKKR